jgi:hypothetical protein
MPTFHLVMERESHTSGLLPFYWRFAAAAVLQIRTKSARMAAGSQSAVQLHEFIGA